MFNFLIRVVLFAFGLLFALSLLAAALLLAALWGVRYAWARLTGKPVTPWVMRFDPRSGFDKFRAAQQPAQPSAADVVNSRARGNEDAPTQRFDDADDVSDVRVKRIQPRAD